MIFPNWKSLPKKPLKVFVLSAFLQLSCLIPVFARAYTSQKFTGSAVPEELKGLKVQEKTGRRVNLDIPFTDDGGNSVFLKQYFKSGGPVLMSIVYYGCPNLCTLHLNGLGQGLKVLSDSFKQEFEWVVLSMDNRENFKLAAEKKQAYAGEYSFPVGRMHFLTGTKKNILQLSRELGFRFRWDENQKIYAHIPVAYVLSPEGVISRYLYGVEFPAKVLKLSLVEAGEGKTGSLIDRVLLFCFQFDPRRGRYTWYAYNIMRAGGLLTIFLLLGFLIPVWIKENHKKRNENAE